MSRRTQENLMALAALGFFAVIFWLSLDYGERARMVPQPVTVLGALLVLGQLFWQNARPADDLQVDLLEVLTGGRGAEPDKPSTARHEGRSVWTAFAMVGALLALVLLLGPFPAIFLFTTAYLARSRYCGQALAVAGAAVFTFALYVLFVVGLQLQVYHGVLEPWARALGL